MTYATALVTLNGQKIYNKMNKHKSFWGIYTNKQSHARALAVAVGATKPPEVHGSGMYGHYHDKKHKVHIWYGGKKFYG